jgi:tetratricopeptide (TPR) repeat protein
LDLDYHYLTLRAGGMSFPRLAVVHTARHWEWVGRMHEVLVPPGDGRYGTLSQLHVVVTTQGARSKDPKKYEKDAAVLLEALQEEPDNARYMFYLGQCYADAGMHSEAIKAYEKRIKMTNGYYEEVFWSCLQMANLHKEMGSSRNVVVEAYLKAAEADRMRVEPYYYLALYYREQKEFEKAYQVAALGVTIPYRENALFMQDWIYEWGIVLELSVAAYWTDRFVESQQASRALLKEPLPDDIRHQVEENLGFANIKILNKIVENKTVLFSILARNKEHVLDRYLSCLEQLDYDKKNMVLYINTNNNSDKTEEILKTWVEKHGAEYRDVIFSSHTVDGLGSHRPHEWSSERFHVLGRIRNESLSMAKVKGCDYYFVVDCDNFITPCTLKELIAKDKPIIAPMLRPIPEKDDLYSNYFSAVNEEGYWQDHPDYLKIFKKEMVGTFEAPVVHCTYLIKNEWLDYLTYVDGSDDYEFVIFSKSARENGVKQYICNEQDFGVLCHFYKDVTQQEEKEALRALAA